jgi:hypothetical protein
MLILQARGLTPNVQNACGVWLECPVMPARSTVLSGAFGAGQPNYAHVGLITEW